MTLPPPFPTAPAFTRWVKTLPLDDDIKAATAGLPVEEVFMTAVSPGTLANFFPNRHYPSREAYLEAMAEVMKREYDAIVRCTRRRPASSP